MKRLFPVLVAILVLCSMLLPACGTPSATPAQSTAPTSVTSGGNKPEGEIILAVPTLGSENFSLDQQFDVSLQSQTNEPIVRSNHTDDPTEPVGVYPCLAERWQVSADGLTWDFFVRQGIQFHNDWGELTAEDFVFTFDLIKDPENHSGANFYFSPPPDGFIKSVEAVSKYQFRINLSARHSNMLSELLDHYTRIYCKKYFDKVGKVEAFNKPIGTGSWKWVETVPADHIKFEAVENHWRQTPAFKYLTFKLVPDASSQVFMLQNGQVNMAVISPDKIDEAKAAGLQIIAMDQKKPVEVYFGGQLMQDHPKFDPSVPWASRTNEPMDSEWNMRALKVRKALCLGINYQSMKDNIMHGYAADYVLHDITMQQPAYNPAWTPFPYDPAQAKQLLKEAGYADGFAKPIQVMIPSTSTTSVNTRAIAEAVANDMEAIGLKVERRVMEQNLIDEEYMMGFDSAWKFRIVAVWLSVNPCSSWNWSRASWSPLDEVIMLPKWDEFTKRANDATTDAELLQIQKEAYAWAYTIYENRCLFIAPYLLAVGKDIKGYSKNPLWQESLSAYDYSFEYLLRNPK